MPCWTSTMVQATLPKIDLDRAKRALIAAGYKILSTSTDTYLNFVAEGWKDKGTVYSDGRIFTDKKGVFQKIYTEQTIKDASRRFGWRVTGRTVSKTGLTTLKLQR